MKHKTVPLFLLVMATLIYSCNREKVAFQVNAPNKQLSVDIDTVGGKIRYAVSSMGDRLVSPSVISIFPNKSVKITGTTERSEDSTWNPTWGQHSEIRNQYNELVIDVSFGTATAQLFIRVFDNGIGFRYRLLTYKENSKVTLYCEYNLNRTDALYCPVGEREPLGPFVINNLDTVDELPKLRVPIVVETNAPYLSILESDLYAAPGCQVMNILYDKEKQVLVSSNVIKLSEGPYSTPWRVILVNENVGELVTNSVPLNLATPLQIDDPNWIKPGKTLWDWRVHGYTTADGFTYGIDTESYKRFIDFASEKNIEYFLIDDAWYKQVINGHFELSDQLDLEAVIDYAVEKDVDLMLYYDRRNGEFGDEDLFPFYQSLGMKGIKYGFMGENVPFTREAIRLSAESHLLINFHDGPVPFTGIERTFPNAITKEYCHAQQDSRRAFTPEAFIKMALINAIQGPLDMNNGNFDLSGINRGDREKGPKKNHYYISTVVSEVARTLIIHSGLVCIPDAPEAYRAKANLFEFIQYLPVGKWNESHVLDAKIGKYIITARRHNESWFVGSVHDQQGGTLNIEMDFLDPGKEYQVTYYEDTEATHGKTNPEAYQIRKGILKKGDTVIAKLAPGGGHCMWIRPTE